MLKVYTNFQIFKFIYIYINYQPDSIQSLKQNFKSNPTHENQLEMSD